MESCVDSEYQNDSSKSPETCTIAHEDNSSDCQKIGNETAVTESRPRKKITRKSRAIGRAVEGKAKANLKADKLLTEDSKRVRKLSVLKRKLVTGRRSVQNNTKTLHRIVPDRIGKYINSNVKREAKLSGRSAIANHSNVRSRESDVDSEECSDMLRDFPGATAIAPENERRGEKESGTFGSRVGSKSGAGVIFEKSLDRLGSTSVVNDASSRDGLNAAPDEESVAVDPERVETYAPVLENVKNSGKDDARMIESEKTPVKEERVRLTPDAPVKTKDHDNYYSRNKVRHVCGYCHKVFKSNGKLNSHVYSHTGERPFDCNNCGKAFSSKFKLVRHLLIHSEIRKFVCQICDRTFLRNDHLKNHYKIHDPQKKMYKCSKEGCDKIYLSLMSHKKHMAYHSVEDGNLKCLICSVKFETKDEILFHLKSHSGSRLFKTQSDKKFKCDFCDRLFLTRKDVTRHLVVHTGERDFLCQFCPQRFGRKDHLVRHIKKSHLNDDIAVKREMLEKKWTKPTRKAPPATATARCRPVQQEEEHENQEPQLLEGDEEEEKEKEQQQQPQLVQQEQVQQQIQQQEQVQQQMQQQEHVQQQMQQDQVQQQMQQQEQFQRQIQQQDQVQQQEQENEQGEEDDEEEEEDEAGEEEATQKTHIVITVKSPVQKRNSKSDSDTKSQPFRKDPSVPKKKPVPLSRTKNSTTQIFLQNIPNILIIPNNSIILLRNQGSSSKEKAKKTDGSEKPTVNTGNVGESADAANYLPVYGDQSGFQNAGSAIPKPPPGGTGHCNPLMDTDMNVTYNCNMFQDPGFASNFPFGEDNLETFQHPGMTDFGGPTENINFDLITPSELLKENDIMTDPGELGISDLGVAESPAKADQQRKIGVVKPITKNIPDEIASGLFGAESLAMNEPALNDFKVDDADILGSDGGMLNNMFGQSGGESAGSEYLRSLLLSDSPIASPLPGFSQIFNHNAN